MVLMVHLATDGHVPSLRNVSLAYIPGARRSKQLEDSRLRIFESIKPVGALDQLDGERLFARSKRNVLRRKQKQSWKELSILNVEICACRM